MSFLQKLLRLISTHCAGDNESPLAAGLPQLQGFEQEAADARLAGRVAELTCIPEPSCTANPQKTIEENYGAWG